MSWANDSKQAADTEALNNRTGLTQHNMGVTMKHEAKDDHNAGEPGVTLCQRLKR